MHLMLILWLTILILFWCKWNVKIVPKDASNICKNLVFHRQLQLCLGRANAISFIKKSVWRFKCCGGTHRICQGHKCIITSHNPSFSAHSNRVINKLKKYVWPYIQRQVKQTGKWKFQETLMVKYTLWKGKEFLTNELSFLLRFGSLHIRIVSGELIRLDTDKKIIQLNSSGKISINTRK